MWIQISFGLLWIGCGIVMIVNAVVGEIPIAKKGTHFITADDGMMLSTAKINNAEYEDGRKPVKIVVVDAEKAS